MSAVLAVFHSQRGNTNLAAEAVAEGSESFPDTEFVLEEACQATSDDLFSCDALALVTQVPDADGRTSQAESAG